MNFENLTVGLYVLIIFSIKFQENQRSIVMSLIKFLHFRVFFFFFYLSIKLFIKSKATYRYKLFLKKSLHNKIISGVKLTKKN